MLQVRECLTNTVTCFITKICIFVYKPEPWGCVFCSHFMHQTDFGACNTRWERDLSVFYDIWVLKGCWGWGAALGWLHFHTTSAGLGVWMAQAAGGEGFSVVHEVFFKWILEGCEDWQLSSGICLIAGTGSSSFAAVVEVWGDGQEWYLYIYKFIYT